MAQLSIEEIRMFALPRLFLPIAAALALSGAYAQTNKDSETVAQSIRTVIEAQLAAFAEDDADKAFSYASDNIRERFGTAENFIAMVKESYPVVYRPASVSFAKPEHIEGQTLQSVKMADDAGRLWLALYSMQRQPDSSWRINGCVLKMLKGSRT
jgi:Domain of unknown function (DUF4864)